MIKFFKKKFKELKKWYICKKLYVQLLDAEKQAIAKYRYTKANQYVLLDHMNKPMVVGKKEIRKLKEQKRLPKISTSTLRLDYVLFEASTFSNQIQSRNRRKRIIDYIYDRL